MAISRYRYLHYDVFTERRFAGNQLAIFPDAAGLSARTMQHIAREIGFAETTFVTAAEDPETDVRMRIFTPGTELPMAGHPVIGSTFALARERRIDRGKSEWVFGLNIGPTDIALEWKDDSLTFVWMTQRLPQFGRQFDDVEAVARALGVGENDIRATGLPIEQVSCGVPFVIVPMTSRTAVDSVVPDPRLLKFEAYVFTVDRADGNDAAHTYSRMFAPAFGVAEDPATGSASGPLGSYLVRHAVVTPQQGKALLNLQGVKLGRPSWIHISIESANGNISRVGVGGTAVFVAEGTMDVED